MTTRNRSLSRGEFLVLAVLVDGPLHGYGVAKAVEARTSGDVTLRPANLYRVLDRLTHQGLLEVVDEPALGGTASPERSSSARGGDRSRYFAVTKAGRAAARREADMLARLIEGSRILAPASDSGGTS